MSSATDFSDVYIIPEVQIIDTGDKGLWETNESTDIQQHSQNRPTGDRWLKH